MNTKVPENAKRFRMLLGALLIIIVVIAGFSVYQHISITRTKERNLELEQKLRDMEQSSSKLEREFSIMRKELMRISDVTKEKIESHFIEVSSRERPPGGPGLILVIPPREGQEYWRVHLNFKASEEEIEMVKEITKKYEDLLGKDYRVTSAGDGVPILV